jgi:hypothetical protein
MSFTFWQLVLAIVLSSAFTSIFLHLGSAHGTLRIDHSNPEKDIYRIEIDDLDELKKKRRAILYVDHHADLSQK